MLVEFSNSTAAKLLGISPISAANASVTPMPTNPNEGLQPTRHMKPNGVSGFVNAIQPYAEKAAARLGVPADFLIAQAAQETGWGHGAHDYNIFNLTGSYHGQSTIRGDTTAGGKAYKTAFRKYQSYDEAFDDYVSLIRRRYKGAMNAPSAFLYGQALKGGGYAADPGYASHIKGMHDKLQRMRGAGLVRQNETTSIPMDRQVRVTVQNRSTNADVTVQSKRFAGAG